MRRWIIPLILVLLSACAASAPPAETSALLAPTILVINPVTAAPATVQTPTTLAVEQTPVVAILPPATRPPANPDLAILRQGWSQDTQGVTLVFVVENTSDQQSYERVPYQIILYAADQRAVGTVDGTLMLLLPGTTVGMVDYALVREPVVALDLVIAAGPTVASTRPSQPIFESQQGRFTEYPTPQVTGIIINNMTREARQVQVSAIVYAADDTIIGGGVRILPRLDARSETEVAIPILMTAAPERVELWASFTPESFIAAQP
jgi:hypothetical protein